MEDKINDNKLSRILKNYVVSWQTLLLISLILFVSDFFLSKPLYVMVLDMGEPLGDVLALGMAALFAVLPKITSKLLAKKDYGLSFMGIVCGIGLLSFIYVGQSEVVRKKTDDPLNLVLADSVEIGSHAHIVATSLVALLYTCALFISFLYYRDNEAFRPTFLRLSMSKLGRAFQYALTPLRGRYKRAAARPENIAEGHVNDFARELGKKERELQSRLYEQESNRNYELAVLDNARKRIKTTIEAAYKH